MVYLTKLSCVQLLIFAFRVPRAHFRLSSLQIRREPQRHAYFCFITLFCLLLRAFTTRRFILLLSGRVGMLLVCFGGDRDFRFFALQKHRVCQILAAFTLKIGFFSNGNCSSGPKSTSAGTQTTQGSSITSPHTQTVFSRSNNIQQRLRVN